MTLRALPKRPKKFATMLYNVFIMRHFDNMMRHFYGQKWLDYKEKLSIKKAEKTLKKQG